MTKSMSYIFVGVLLISGLAVPTFAGNDASIKGVLRDNINTAMAAFIMKHSVNGIYTHFDPITGKVEKLTLKKRHSGIVKKGDFYVSCADFTNESGTLVDIDFMVINRAGELFVNQALIHKVGKKKRAYHIES